MSKGKALIRNTAIYTFGTFGSKVLIFLLVPLFSFYLTAIEMGQYDMILISVSLAVPLITLQISDAAYRWIIDCKESEIRLRQVVTSGFVLVSGFLILVWLLALVISLYWEIPYLWYFVSMVSATAYFTYFQQVIRGMGFTKFFALFGILQSFLILGLSLFFLLVLDKGLEGILIANILAVLLTSAIQFFWKIITKIRFSMFSRPVLISLLKYSLPLIPNSISWWLINIVNRYVILIFLSIYYNGIYAISARFPAILIMINSVFILAWQDQFIQEKKTDSEFSIKVFDRYVKFEFGLVLILISISELLAKYAVDDTFYEARRYMPFLFLATAVSAFAAYFGAFYLKRKETKDLFLSTLLGGIVNLAFSFGMISFIGLYAPAIGTLIGFLTVLLYRVRQTKDVVAINITPFLTLFLASIVMIALKLIENTVIDFFLIITSLTSFFLMNKKTFKTIYTSLFNEIRINR